MMLSMYSGVSGLKSFQTQMDVIGNNVANVSTTGFKSSSVTFAETLSQTLQAATAPQGNRGGTNAMQVGLGVSVASINVNQTQGNLQSTGNDSDLAIQGNGFFIVNNGSQDYYTRVGNFIVDSDNNLVSAVNGYMLQGWMAEAGVVDTTKSIGDIQIVLGQVTPAVASTEATLSGNLNANDAKGATSITTIEAYDSLGVKHNITVTFTKDDTNTWSWAATDEDGTAVGNSTTALKFNTDGTLASGGTGNITYTPSSGADELSLNLDFSSIRQQSLDDSEVTANADGYGAGVLQSYTFDSNGKVIGTYSNGLTQTIAQVALATFANPSGLTNNGGTLFSTSSNSGTAVVGTPGQGSKGTIATGRVEMSNVNLADEFSQMIITERGFQANSRSITTSDEMLQELVNLKR